MDQCPSCGEPLSGRTLEQSRPADRGAGHGPRHLRRCPACHRLAQRNGDSKGGWTDVGADPSIDYLFEWKPEPLPDPWALAPPDTRTILEAELHIELAEGHPLLDLPVIAIARCHGCDDAVFSIETDPAWFALVHLTWSGHRETPPWPRHEQITMPLSRSLTQPTH